MTDEERKQVQQDMDDRRREWAQEVEAGMKENDARNIEYWEKFE